MKIQLNEKIDISPKIVLIDRFSDLIDENMIINFLINNILLLEFNSFEKIKYKNNILGCLINLDEYLFNIDTLNNNFANEINQIIESIKSIEDLYIAAFTIHKFQKIKEMFSKEGIKYFVRMGNTKDEMVNIIKELISPFKEKRCNRSSLRIGFVDRKYSAEIKDGGKIYNGIIIDLSINGVGIEVNDIESFKYLHIGRYISINMDFGIVNLNILRGIIVRKNNKKNLIGIKFNITDKYEIDEENIIILKNIIRTWIIKAIHSKSMDISNKELFLNGK